MLVPMKTNVFRYLPSDLPHPLVGQQHQLPKPVQFGLFLVVDFLGQLRLLDGPDLRLHDLDFLRRNQDELRQVSGTHREVTLLVCG